jgi:hypothetical protein
VVSFLFPREANFPPPADEAIRNGKCLDFLVLRFSSLSPFHFLHLFHGIPRIHPSRLACARSFAVRLG